YTFVDAADPGAWAKARRPTTRLFLVETIANPLMRVPRLREVVDFARRERLTTLIDNTFASPVNFRPIPFGFDLAFHSATKYLNGHSDLVAGCVVGRKELVDRVRHTLNHFGGSLDPHAAFLLARGLKTLALRVRAQNATATALARFLSAHPSVLAVNYPGLESHPDHAHAREALSGFGGMLSVRLKGGEEAAERLLRSVTIAYAAPSLGGVETLITRPALTSHAGMSRADREHVGVTDDLVRISCGIEHAEDLIEDFGRALEA
ncbi:MAG: PLP-dependent transferase, partial [Acidobacteria bacterium]|nr:PLP-dependent transferase [Acidobacteriota bacterium]